MEQTSVQIQSWSKEERFVLRFLGCFAFAFLTALSAHVRIPLPFTPVPMTLQTFVVPLAGGFLGAAWGAGSMVFYLVLGIFGLNAFAAAGSGLRVFLAPTSGYLLGFIVAAAVVGLARSQSRSNSVLLLSLIASHAVIFLFGIGGLILNAEMPAVEAIQKGILPFLPGDVIKITASFLVLYSFDHFRKAVA